ncbi:beta-1,3-glucanase domain-containing protein [Sarocladium implicatum]|nr:beta-1,3-glucanase domain-containing protein [Sarocladium implicatum]
MKFLFALAALAGLAMAAPKPNNKGFTIIKPGKVEDVIIGGDNTLNGTYHKDKGFRMKVADVDAKAAPTLDIEIVNNHGGGAVNMYIQALDPNDRIVFLGADGNLIYPSSGGSAVPVEIKENLAIPLPGKGGSKKVTLPMALHSGRIYFAEGTLSFFMVIAGGGKDGLVQPSIKNLQDPSAGVNYGFSEFTLTPEGVIWTNISFVDFVGLVISAYLKNKDGSAQEVIGLPGNSVPAICNDLVTQGQRDGKKWAAHCIARPDGSPLRVVSPEAFKSIDPSAFAGYYEEYVDQVWDRFRNEDLIIDTQAPPGDVRCRVKGDTLECDGDNRGYAKPTTEDIWGCNSGPFEILGGDNDIHRPVVPRLCAALYRTTMLLAGGERQPSLGPEKYYKNDPTSHYGRILHERHVDGKGYAFSYDDVHPAGYPDTAGLMSSGNAEVLRFTVGGSA